MYNFLTTFLYNKYIYTINNAIYAVFAFVTVLALGGFILSLLMKEEKLVNA